METVDLALVLAVDGSASVTYDEFGLIAGGMAAALRDPVVIAGLTGGPAKASYCCLLLWSGRRRAGCDRRLDPHRQRRRRPGICRCGGQHASYRCRPDKPLSEKPCWARSPCSARVPANPARSVVDVVGDGRSNQGIAPGPIRDRMASANITINGLCILHEEPDLLESYTREVIGGPGAFAVVCADYPDFAAAMKQKLARETNAPTV